MVSNPFSGDNSVEVELRGDGSSLNNALSSAERKMGGFKKAVGGLGAALGGLAVGGLAKSASAAMSFEDAMADVEKVTDAQTAEELSEPIQQMAEDLPLAAEELAGLAADAGRFGAEGTEEIEDFTRVAAEMGSATQLSSDEAAQSLAKVATALDEPLDNVEALGDSINELSNNFATDSQEIVDAAQRGGFAVSDMGLTSDEVLGLSAAMNEVAPTSRQAATMMEQVGESMTDRDNIAAFADALGVTQEEFSDMQDENPEETMFAIAEAMNEGGEASETLADSLSTQQVRAFERVGQQTDEAREAMELSNDAMEEGGSLAREVAIETDTARGQWKLLKSELMNVAREIGQNLLPPLTNLMSRVSDGVSVFSRFNEETNGMAGVVALVGTAIGGFTLALAALIGPMGAVISGLGLLLAPIGSLIALMGTVLAPLGTAIGLFSGLAAPIIGAAGAITTFLAPLSGLIAGLAGTLGPIGLLIGAIGVLGYAFKENQEVITNFANQAIGILSDVVRDAATWIQNNGPDLIGRAFQALGEGIRFVVLDIYNAITGNGDSLLKSIIIDAGSWIVNNGPGILKSAAETAFEVILAAARGLYEGLIGNSIIPDTFNDVASYIRNDAASDLASAAREALSSFTDAFDVRGAVDDALSGAQERISSWTPDWPDLSMPDIDTPSVSDATDAGGSAVDRGRDLVGLDTGGYIKSDGLAMLHAGERVLPEEDVDRGGISGGGTQRVELVLEERTDVVQGRIEQGAEMVVEQRERRTHRNSGRNLSPR